MMKYFVLLIVFIAANVHAKNLGALGETFEISEPDLLEVIEQKINQLAKDGTLEKHQHAIQQKTQERIQRPLAVSNIVKTKKSRTFKYDPSIHVPYDIKDHQGTVFIKAGSVVNPLDYQSFNKVWLFIDGDDTVQVQWALKYPEPRKIILIQGAPFQLMEKHQIYFYFDQGGSLVNKFGIQQVPARVRQEGKVLMVEELLVEAS